uniref:auxin-induced in root cultures protein 12-like n=1 Tax=Erigeron canadensis TaxID=72917 RepID=UPI001CB94F46|nr:auxin-induced in root cultures protein 12-like [Erigeron canadensis]
MAVLRLSLPLSSFLILIFTLFILRLSPVHSTCTSQKFTNNKTYSNCTNLPTLNSTLHYTFTPKNMTMSVAFVAIPATSDGWIAWAINPTDTGMAGCQSFIAFKDSKGSMLVKTYNISSYSSIIEGKLSFEVLDSSAEFSKGTMMIFATVKLPMTMMEINHVWQVGGSVMNGVPMKHEFLPGNLKAMAKLQLEGMVDKSSNGTSVGSPMASPNTNSAPGLARVCVVLMFLGYLLGLIF